MPKVISTPPSSTKSANSATPLMPMPPRTSSVSAYIPSDLNVVVLPVGQRLRQLRLLVDQGLAALGLVRDDDDVVLRPQPRPGLDVVLVDEVEGNLEAIEGQPHPADLLGVGPGRVDRDPRQVHVGRRHAFRHRRERRGDQPQRLHLGGDALGLAAGLDQERAGRELAGRRGERRAGAAHRQVLQPVAQGDQVQRAGVLDRDDRPAALPPTRR